MKLRVVKYDTKQSLVCRSESKENVMGKNMVNASLLYSDIRINLSPPYSKFSLQSKENQNLPINLCAF